jgi:hypothetical protein
MVGGLSLLTTFLSSFDAPAAFSDGRYIQRLLDRQNTSAITIETPFSATRNGEPFFSRILRPSKKKSQNRIPR